MLCGGATIRRPIPIKGAHLKGVHQAMDFLKQNNQRVDGQTKFDEVLSAKIKTLLLLEEAIQVPIA